MRIDKLEIKDFKNLQNFEIDLNDKHMESVILWKNATWKSNFFEAVILIFKSLDLDKTCEFEYKIKYECNKNNIVIDFIDNKIEFHVNENKITKKSFYENKSEYLPKNLFTYYSWINKRVEWYFDDHQKKFYNELINDNVKNPERPFFFARLIHSLYVMLAFYSFDDKKINKFLSDHFQIEWIESILFKIQIPERAEWKTDKKKEYFWKSWWIVWEFLEDLFDISLAPIKDEIIYSDSFRNQKSKKKDWVFLYVKNIEDFKEIAKKYWSNRDFFSVLESTYISDLIYDIKIKVKKKDINWEIYFKELSEWEQQLLVVLWLLIFTWDEESLILLDEPDTHLNPRWKWDYINILNENINKSDTTQILMTTHDPLVIWWLEREQIQIFSKDEDWNTITNNPKYDVKWLWVAGILTSDLFELPTTLDKETQDSLDEMRKLQIRRYKWKLEDWDNDKLVILEDKLENLGISKTIRDPLYEKFLYALEENDYKKIINLEKNDEKVKKIKKTLNDNNI